MAEVENNVSPSGLTLDILKMEVWAHMGCTAHIIIEDVIHIFASISKNGMVLTWVLNWWTGFSFQEGVVLVFIFQVAPEINIKTLRPRPYGRHFADNILWCIFLNENVWISIEFSLKFVPKGPIDNIPALV